MNGTIIDIPGIAVSVTPISMQDSSDVAYHVCIKDLEKEVILEIIYGKITSTWIK